MNEQTRKPSSGTHMIDRNVLREDASPCQRVPTGSVRGAASRPRCFRCRRRSERVLIRSVRAFLDSEQQGENRSRYGERLSAATANGSDKSETIQATADELAHAMAPRHHAAKIQIQTHPPHDHRRHACPGRDAERCEQDDVTVSGCEQNPDRHQDCGVRPSAACGDRAPFARFEARPAGALRREEQDGEGCRKAREQHGEKKVASGRDVRCETQHKVGVKAIEGRRGKESR